MSAVLSSVSSQPPQPPQTPQVFQSAFQLTADQQNGLDRFVKFLLDPNEEVLVISGYSGCGKSTLVKTLLEQLPIIMKTIWLINPNQEPWKVDLTATTNKAAENLASITGQTVRTIHSTLGLRVRVDYATRITTLVPARTDALEDRLIFIDEASYVDSQLLQHIFALTKNCKIVFVGDPAQLAPIKAKGVPVFDAKFPKIELKEVVRQAFGNPIIDLATKFRETVNTGKFFSFQPDGFHIQYLEHDAFELEVEAEFTRKDWKYADSKILAWTNKRVMDFNHFVRDKAHGDPQLDVGDYAVCNNYYEYSRGKIKTDEMVQITKAEHNVQEHDVDGVMFEINGQFEAFMPYRLRDRAQRIKQAKINEEYLVVDDIDDAWIDLRSAYACTVNKAQGSTFDKVFIDLDDISRCNSGNQIARMLYVAVSRARHQVFLTGDIA